MALDRSTGVRISITTKNADIIIITLYGRIEGLFIVTRAGFPKLPLRSFFYQSV